MDWADWVRRCTDLLAANRITVDGYRYTASAVSPGSPDVYANQALWDSCFHAITLRWIDPPMAYDELLSLASRQVPDGPDAGMIPHMIYWRGGAESLWQRPDHSLISMPPLIAIAARLVYQVQPQRSALETLYPRLCAFHDWFDRRRDPDHDHLVSLIHPWESGWDASPRWDHAMKLSHPTYPEARATRRP